MKRRSGKYLNAREYAERLRLSDNKDVQDFAEEFLEALDALDDPLDGTLTAAEAKEQINGYVEDAPESVKTYADKIEWIGGGSDALLEIEKTLATECPEYGEDEDTQDIIADLIRRVHSKQVYDL